MFNLKKILLAIFLALAPTQSTAAQNDHTIVPIVLDLLSSSDTTSPAPTVKKTGQTKSYNEYGSIVLNIKDDAHYQTGVTSDYTRASNIVTDKITKLMWQDDYAASGSSSTRKKWVTSANYNARRYSDTSGDTATTQCNTLALGGYTDWRLPTVRELQSITVTHKREPAFHSIFQKQSTFCYYWSSTVPAGKSYAAMYVWSRNGGTHYDAKDGTRAVRCVRTAQ